MADMAVVVAAAAGVDDFDDNELFEALSVVEDEGDDENVGGAPNENPPPKLGLEPKLPSFEGRMSGLAPSAATCSSSSSSAASSSDSSSSAVSSLEASSSSSSLFSFSSSWSSSSSFFFFFCTDAADADALLVFDCFRLLRAVGVGVVVAVAFLAAAAALALGVSWTFLFL